MRCPRYSLRGSTKIRGVKVLSAVLACRALVPAWAQGERAVEVVRGVAAPSLNIQLASSVLRAEEPETLSRRAAPARADEGTGVALSRCDVLLSRERPFHPSPDCITVVSAACAVPMMPNTMASDATPRLCAGGAPDVPAPVRSASGASRPPLSMERHTRHPQVLARLAPCGPAISRAPFATGDRPVRHCPRAAGARAVTRVPGRAIDVPRRQSPRRLCSPCRLTGIPMSPPFPHMTTPVTWRLPSAACRAPGRSGLLRSSGQAPKCVPVNERPRGIVWGLAASSLESPDTHPGIEVFYAAWKGCLGLTICAGRPDTDDPEYWWRV